MKDKLLIYWQKIIKNVDKSIVVFQGILLLVIIFIYMRDSDTVIEQPQDPMPKPIESILPSDNYTNVKRLFVDEPKLESDENYRSLQEYNMFDFKVVRERETYMKDWDEKYKTAESLFAQGQYKESLDILKQVLLHWPGHIKAKELRKTVEEKLRPPVTPSPTPTPPPPPGGEMGGMPAGAPPGAGADGLGIGNPAM